MVFGTFLQIQPLDSRIFCTQRCSRTRRTQQCTPDLQGKPRGRDNPRGQKRRNETGQKISTGAVEVAQINSAGGVRSILARRCVKRVHQSREREENAIGAKFLSLWGAAGLSCVLLLARSCFVCLLLCFSVSCSLWVCWFAGGAGLLGCLAGGLAGAFGCLVFAE